MKSENGAAMDFGLLVVEVEHGVNIVFASIAIKSFVYKKFSMKGIKNTSARPLSLEKYRYLAAHRSIRTFFLSLRTYEYQARFPLHAT